MLRKTLFSRKICSQPLKYEKVRFEQTFHFSNLNITKCVQFLELMLSAAVFMLKFVKKKFRKIFEIPIFPTVSPPYFDFIP